MSQQPLKPKVKLTPRLESTLVIHQPAVRDYSTGGGHLPGDELFEGVGADANIETKKWQGYPPVNLNVVGKPMPPLPEVAIPRYTGKAEYATRVVLPNMLHVKVLTSPHPRARIRALDTSKAERMPGVAAILTYRNGPAKHPLPQELNFQGQIVAFVAAETEDLAEDAVAAIEVDYEILPSASTVRQVMASEASERDQRLNRRPPDDFHSAPDASWIGQQGDVEQGFREADVVRDFAYYFAGGVSVPMQPLGGVAKWDGDRLTFWAMNQGIYPYRDELAAALGIPADRIRYINKYNGCTFGAAMEASWLNPFIAHLAKLAGRPVKLMLQKDEELARLQIKPENITRLKLGAKQDGRIVAIQSDVYMSAGDADDTWGGGHCATPIELYGARTPHIRSKWYCYRTNAMPVGPSRSYQQQESKWAWEIMIDEMAEALGMDPVQFRLINIAKPGDPGLVAIGGPGEDQYKYDSHAGVEVLLEGAKAFGWDRRNPVPGGHPGRFKKGMGVGMSQHHGGQLGYHEGEVYFERLEQRGRINQPYGAELELDAAGNVTMKNALPDSGTNHDTALAHMVAEILGFTTRDRIRLVWGDTETTPLSGRWYAGRTITQQAGPVCIAADKLRKDLLNRAAAALKVDLATLQIRDGVISSTTNPRQRITFAQLARAAGGSIRQSGRGGGNRAGRVKNKGVGACFVEVEVDTWTGDWRFLRAVYCHDTGLVVNPLVAEADMHGSLIQSLQITTDGIPWDREFPGTRHYGVGYLSYRLPTIMDVPEDQTQVFVNSLDPRWFFGAKSFSETTIGSVPGAIANAIYNACGVRLREHPITREKILAGVRALKGEGSRV
jgi:CO/xanthine dehydrogenase Mo-binding subunit